MDETSYEIGYQAGKLVGMAMVIAAILIPYIFYLITLSKALKECAEHNRKMKPGEVWLVFIPLFGIVWHFIVVARVADSLAAEFQMWGIPINEPRPGFVIGIVSNVLSVLAWSRWMVGLLPYAFMFPVQVFGGLCSLAGFICWIVYWVRIARYKRKLHETPLQFGNVNPYPFPQQFPNQPPQNPYQ